METPTSPGATAGNCPAPATGQPRRDTARAVSRAPYFQPTLERPGAWSTLTLQQSIPIFP
jgi:hypothetical protein